MKVFTYYVNSYDLYQGIKKPQLRGNTKHSYNAAFRDIENLLYQVTRGIIVCFSSHNKHLLTFEVYIN